VTFFSSPPAFFFAEKLLDIGDSSGVRVFPQEVRNESNAMFQRAARFGLVIHHETKEISPVHWQSARANINAL
jgi:hypothetical protein